VTRLQQRRVGPDRSILQSQIVGSIRILWLEVGGRSSAAYMIFPYA
jgi:hypothetical protein